jgi:hypothetical protein
MRFYLLCSTGSIADFGQLPLEALDLRFELVDSASMLFVSGLLLYVAMV